MNPELAKWEERLNAILRVIDAKLEDEYGGVAPLHPSRPGRGATSNPQYDGLFRLTAPFTAGYGSELGEGYLFRVEFATLAHIAPELAAKVEKSAVAELRKNLSAAFPVARLRVDKDGASYKIHGDLSLW